MASTHTLTGNVFDLTGATFGATGLRVYVVTNLPPREALVDKTTNGIHLGGKPADVNTTTGEFDVDLIDTSATDLNVQANTLEYEVRAEFVNPATSVRSSWASGWFPLTADANLADVTTDASPMAAVSASAYAQEAAGYRDETLAAKQAVEERVVDDLGTTDGQTKALLETPSSLTAQALSATIAAGAVAKNNALGNTLTKVGVVLGLGGSGEFDELVLESFNPVFVPEVGRYAAVYTGYGTAAAPQNMRASVGIAWSDDGLTWTKGGKFYEYDGGVTETGTTGPQLIRDGSTWWLVYIGLDGFGYEGGNKTIKLASTPSLTAPAWTRHGNIITTSAGGNGWANLAIWHPNVFKVGATWYCFLNALGDVGGESKERIGYATAPDITGPWTLSATHVIPDKPGYDVAGDPFLTRIDGGWRMDFFRSGPTTGDYYATTTDALFPGGWVVGNNDQPILTSGPAGSFDGFMAHKPAILHIAGRVFHYYTAVKDTGSAYDERTTALAVDPPFVGASGEVGTQIFIEQLRSLGVLMADLVDQFERADSTGLGTAPTGQAWVADVGAWAIVGQKARAQTLVGNIARTSVNTGIVPSEITVTLAALPSWGAWGVMARFSDLSNYFEVAVNPAGEVKIDKIEAGAASGFIAYTSGASFGPGDKLTISDDGTGLAIKRNGTIITSAPTTFNYGANEVGFWAYLAEDEDAFTGITVT